MSYVQLVDYFKVEFERERGCKTVQGIDPEAFRFALSQITDGTIFERFALDFLSKVLGYNFIPIGGVRDRGIDGMEHTFHRHGYERAIYQLTIEKDYKTKIRDSLEKLVKNDIRYDQFIYVTNIPVASKDILIDQFVERYKKAILIWDIDWFANHVNESEVTVRAYQIFIESYLHQFNRPGQTFTIANLEGDPRVYVFLRQQVEQYRNDLKMDEILADTLIVYALEGTDPDKGILCTRDEILERIPQIVKFDPRLLHNLIDQRLKVLSAKPRRINHHAKEDAYCLPFEERLAIQNRNLKDMALYDSFRKDTVSDFTSCFPKDTLSQDDAFALIEEALHLLFSQQGLEFAGFVLRGASQDVFEKYLPDIISDVVEKSAKAAKNRTAVKSALLTCIRNMAYSGTEAQKKFLDSLSRTYMMLFLLQCDPQVATYFSSLASKLRIYVCTSIIIPALSERFLDSRNQRYTNLLLGANKAGVQLLFNEAILQELAAHFRMIRKIYEDNYAGAEDLYTDEMAILYIPEIMIRAYFYARLRGRMGKFDDFLGTFVSPSMDKLEEDLVEWLKSELSLEYVTNASRGIYLDKQEVQLIQEELVKHKKLRGKGAQEKAGIDAYVMLTILAIREQHNELGKGGISGFRTWWLSSDVLTQKAATIVSKEKYSTPCYMRPDFLYNYISLAPSKGEVDQAFRAIFPTFLGVNISYHVPDEVPEMVSKFVKEYKERNPGRIKAVIRELTGKLQNDPEYQVPNRVKTFFVDHLKQLGETVG